MRYRDRHHAGRVLGRCLERWRGRPDLIVFALPRGGVPVGWEVARWLDAPLDLFPVRQIRARQQEELVIGAIASPGIVVLNDGILSEVPIAPEALDRATAVAREELALQQRMYRESETPPDVRGSTVVLVDDGLATGATMRAAIQAAQAQHAREVIVAVPVGSIETCRELEDEGATVICAINPDPFFAVGPYYEDFGPTSDTEIILLLRRPTVPRAASRAEAR